MKKCLLSLIILFTMLVIFSSCIHGNSIFNKSDKTTGELSEDLYLRVESPYEARRCVTDKDVMISMVVANISGFNYVADNVKLEMKNGRKWESINYRHANLGLLSNYSVSCNNLFIDEPLAAGDYRMQLDVTILNGTEVINSSLKPECEFKIIPHAEAPVPIWDKSRLERAGDYDMMQSENVHMSFINPVLNHDNRELEFIITADDVYHFGSHFEVNVLLDATWYKVPFGQVGFHDLLLTYDPNVINDGNLYKELNPDPVECCQILPAGTYRIIKEFTPAGPRPGDELVFKPGIEYTVTEFTVEETLEWSGLYTTLKFD